MREILTRPGRLLTQGSIFNNALSSNHHEVYGLIISARCDVENHHHPSLNYVPVIPMLSWTKKELCRLTMKAVYKEEIHKLAKLFRDKGLDLHAAINIGIIRVLEHHFGKKEQEHILDSWKILELRSKAVMQILTDAEALEILLKFSKSANRILQDLIDNELQGYFYIENVDYTQQDRHLSPGFVIDLLEIRNIPSICAESLINGIDINHTSIYRGFFSREEETFVIGELVSPFVESVVQSCVAQFRVGIDRAQVVSLDSLLGGTK